MKIVKVNNLPQIYEADTIYLVKSSTAGLVDIYVTDNIGTQIRSLAVDTAVINSLLQVSEVGVTVASLVDGKVPTNQLPSAILGALSYQGTWNASTNSPAVPAAATDNKGWYYVVSIAGTTSIGGIDDWQIGDWLVSNGVSWGKIDNSDKVSSVAGKTGAVTLSKTDVGLGNVDDTSDANKSVLSATKLTTARTINGVTFDGSANISVPVDWSAVTGKPAVIAAGTDAATARSAIGAASLVGGKIPEHELPSLAITDVFPVTSEAEMLALTAEKGDMAIRSDLNKCFALSETPASTLANWLELKTPANAVLSVAGKTGAVTLNSSDVGLGNVDDTSDADKPVSTAQQNALNLKANLTSPSFTGRVIAQSSPESVGISALQGSASGFESLAQGNGGTAGAAIITFHRPANFVTYFGLDTDNKIKVGGGTMGVNAYAIYHENNKPTKSDVGLSNVDNTNDASKPVSNAQLTALNAKAPLASPALTGVPTAPTAEVGTNTTQIATTAFVLANVGSSSSGGGEAFSAF